MKGFIITISFMLIILFALSSNGYADVNVGYGLKGGISVMKIKNSDAEDSDSIVEPCFGVFFSVNYSSGFAIQPELLLTIKGGKTDYSKLSDLLVIEYDRYTYLELPFLVKYNVDIDKSIKFSIFSGPSIGMLLGAGYKLTGYDADYMAGLLGISTEGSLSDLGANLNPFEFSLQFGLGMSYKLTSGIISLDIRYCLGMTNVIKSTPEVDNKNRGLIVMAGYSF